MFLKDGTVEFLAMDIMRPTADGNKFVLVVRTEGYPKLKKETRIAKRKVT